jgi:hypothetical protein
MTAFVLGNGRSRENIDIDLLLTLGSVYGCNALYRTHTVTALVATDAPIAQAIQDSGYSQHHRFYTRRPRPGTGAMIVPKPYHGFSSGPIAAGLAALDGHKEIYLLGFDLGSAPGEKFNNIYADTEFYKPSFAEPTFSGNWIRQIKTVAGDFPSASFFRVHGPSTAEAPELADAKNLLRMDLGDFLRRINTSKDL